MEVHHHSADHSGKKNFKVLFLEFVMIFLAVTLGFFAESLRENIIEKKQLHGYMEQMVENLKFDTTRCGNAIKYNIEEVTPRLDTLRYEIDKASNGEVHANKLYSYYLTSLKFSGVLFKQSTITQLKNSGRLRLIENKELLNKILEYYDRWVIAAGLYLDRYFNSSNELSQNGDNFFYRQYFNELIKSDSIFSIATDAKSINYIDSVIYRDPPLELLNKNPAELKKLNNKVCNVEIALQTYNSMLRLNKNLADTLILNIRKEYNLEDK